MTDPVERRAILQEAAQAIRDEKQFEGVRAQRVLEMAAKKLEWMAERG